MLQVLQLDLASRGMKKSETPGVVICDVHGNPLVVVLEHQPGVEVITTRRDPNFARDLAQLGIKDVVTNVTTIKSPPIPSGYQPLVLP